MTNVTELFSGAAVLANTSDNVKVEMKDGLGFIKNVEKYLSKGGNICAKIIFSETSNKDDEKRGHIEYLSLSEGSRFASVFQKLAYIAKHSTNEAARNAYLTLPSPAEAVIDQEGNPIVFTTNDELDGIREQFGEDVTFIWNNDKEETRTAIKFNNKEEYIQKYISVMNLFANENFLLKVRIDEKKGFQRLVSIEEPKL